MKEMFSEEEMFSLKTAEQGVPHMNDAIAENAANRLAVATRAVELVAARGGTMTAEELSELVTPRDGYHLTNESGEALGTHIAAQGARLAVVEKERDDARDVGARLAQSLAMTEAERDKTLSDWREYKAAKDKDVEEWRTERDNARTSETVWRKRLDAVAEELADVAPGELGRLDVLGRVRALKAQVEALQTTGAVLSAHVDKTAGGGEPPVWLTPKEEEIFTTGAEAMRAACWEALQTWAQGRGLTREESQSLKAAIEGATP